MTSGFLGRAARRGASRNAKGLPTEKEPDTKVRKNMKQTDKTTKAEPRNRKGARSFAIVPAV